MGARPSSFKRGGGYLNEVDATIVGYTFDVGEETTIKQGPRKGEPFTPLSLVPQFEVDGDDDSKDEPKTQRLLIGDADGYGDVIEDGQVLNTPDGQGIGAKSEAGLFIGSLCSTGFPEDRFSESDTEIDFRPMIGTRVRLIQQVNADKRKQKNKKTGKEYDGRDLLVATVHEVPAAGKGGKAKGASAPAAKGKGKAKDADDVDIPELSAATLTAVLEKNGGSIAKSKLSMAVLKHLTRDENRETVREWLFDDDNLASIEGVTYNTKKQTITLDEN